MFSKIISIIILGKKNYDKGIDKGSTYSITTCGSNKDCSWNILSCTLLKVEYVTSSDQKISIQEPIKLLDFQKSSNLIGSGANFF